MTTTIQVSETTKQLLEKIKEKKHATSYDQIIQQLVKKYTGVAPSLFGSVKGLHWNKKDRLDFHEL